MSFSIALALLALVMCPLSLQAAELTLSSINVSPGAYVVVGDLGPQSYDNDGLNANLGFVVTDDGVIVIDTGPSVRVARALHEAIRRVTQKPIALVVNTNSQNQRWLGNAFFRELRVPIVAHRAAVAAMKDQGTEQIEALRAILREKAQDTVAVFPDEIMDEKRNLHFRGTDIVLLHSGPAHTAGDVAIWLPSSGILFAGDIVYTERLLAILASGSTRQWIDAFDTLAALKPRMVVPGHGRPTDLAAARRHTRNYLTHIRSEVRSALEKGLFVQDTVERADQSAFSRLVNFEQLSRRNVYQTYLEMEFE